MSGLRLTVNPRGTREAIAARWFAGALLLAAALVALDIALRTKIVVIALLALPPLVAAMRCGTARTGVVGVACLLLGIVLGITDHMFGSREHVIDVSAVAAVGLAAVYVARARSRLERSARRARMLARAGSVLQRSLDYENSLTELARLAVPGLADWCAVVVRREDGGVHQVAAVHHDPAREQLARRLQERYPADPETPAGASNVIRTGEAEFYAQMDDSVLERLARDGDHLNLLRELALTSSLILPLRARGRILGAIVFNTDAGRPMLDAADRALAEDLAERAAVALDNAQLYARASAAERELRTSRDQLGAILDGVADGVIAQDATGKMVYANEAALGLLGFPTVKAIQAVPIRYVLSRFEVFDEDGAPLTPDRLPGRQALRGDQPADLLVRMRRRDGSGERWIITKATPIRDPEGALVLAISVFEDVTEHMERRRSERVLGRAGELLATSLDYERTLARIAALAVPDIGDFCVVDVVGEREIRRVATAGPDAESTKLIVAARGRHRLDPAAEQGIPHVLRSGVAELYPSVESLQGTGALSDEQHGLAERLGMRSAMFVPMNAHGRTLGVITMMTSDASGRVFDESDLVLAQELADRCAIAVDNARLFRERSRIARTLQQSLLPAQLPELPGLDVAARFHAAGQDYEVGGDFYDVFEVGGGSVGVVVGDVCGKGPDAAAITAVARHTVRASALHESSPARLLRALNSTLLRERSERRFCTVAYVRIDATTTGVRATIAAGGHPLPLVLRAHGDAGEAGVPGTVLGIVDDPDLTDFEVDLGPGDVIVLYTDGVTEARAPARIYGANDLVGFAGNHELLRADAIADRIERGAMSAQAQEPRDDVAIVVVKVRPSDVPPAPDTEAWDVRTA